MKKETKCDSTPTQSENSGENECQKCSLSPTSAKPISPTLLTRKRPLQNIIDVSLGHYVFWFICFAEITSYPKTFDSKTSKTKLIQAQNNTVFLKKCDSSQELVEPTERPSYKCIAKNLID